MYHVWALWGSYNWRALLSWPPFISPSFRYASNSVSDSLRDNRDILTLLNRITFRTRLIDFHGQNSRSACSYLPSPRCLSIHVAALVGVVFPALRSVKFSGRSAILYACSAYAKAGAGALALWGCKYASAAAGSGDKYRGKMRHGEAHTEPPRPSLPPSFPPRSVRVCDATARPSPCSQ